MASSREPILHGGFTTSNISDVLYRNLKTLFAETVFHRDRFHSREFVFPLDALHLIMVRLALFFAGMGVLMFAIRPRRIRLTLLLPWLGALVLGLGYLRNLGYVPLVTLSVLLIKWRRGDFQPFANVGGSTPVFFTALLAVCLLAGNVWFRGVSGTISTLTGNGGHVLGTGTIRQFSDELPDYLLDRYPDTRFHNTYEIGSFLVWKWWPHKKVFIDNKFSAYHPSFRRWVNRTHRSTLLRELNLNHSVMEVGSTWMNHFNQSPGWGPIATDGNLIAFKRQVRRP